MPVNQAFDPTLYKDDSKDTLIDYLTARLGYNKVHQLQCVDSWQPESAQRVQPAQQTIRQLHTHASNSLPYWQLQDESETSDNINLVSFSARPLSLLTPAVLVDVIALLPDCLLYTSPSPRDTG